MRRNGLQNTKFNPIMNTMVGRERNIRLTRPAQATTYPSVLNQDF